jgi:ribosome silencing factor RsfS/YbeB/iojap
LNNNICTELNNGHQKTANPGRGRPGRRQGQEIRIYDTTHLTSLFDRVAIASGTSNRQTKALAASVRDKVKAKGGNVVSVEGEDTGEWVLVDLGDMIVHIMQPAIRTYYRLEEIWGDKEVKLGAAKRTGTSAAAKRAAAEAPAPKTRRTRAQAEAVEASQALDDDEDAPKKPARKPRATTTSTTGTRAAARPAPPVPPAPRPRRPRPPPPVAPQPAARPDHQGRHHPQGRCAQDPDRQDRARGARQERDRQEAGRQAHQQGLMQLVIAAVGHKMPAWIETGFQEYAKRMPPECGSSSRKSNPSNVPAAAPKPMAQGASDRSGAAQGRARDRARRTRARLDLGAAVAAAGPWQQDGRDVAFLIGGADGSIRLQGRRRYAHPHLQHDPAARHGARDAGRAAVPRLVDHAEPSVSPRLRRPPPAAGTGS